MKWSNKASLFEVEGDDELFRDRQAYRPSVAMATA